MSTPLKPLRKPDPLDAAADQVIAACDGDIRAAVCALIVATGLLETELKDVCAAHRADHDPPLRSGLRFLL